MLGFTLGSVTVTGHTLYHRELPEGVLRVVNFWTEHYNGGCELAALGERWRTIADALK